MLAWQLHGNRHRAAIAGWPQPCGHDIVWVQGEAQWVMLHLLLLRPSPAKHVGHFRVDGLHRQVLHMNASCKNWHCRLLLTSNPRRHNRNKATNLQWREYRTRAWCLATSDDGNPLKGSPAGHNGQET